MVDRDFWKSRPVLVTGGTGLLGGWLIRSLVKAEARVVCVIRDRVPQSELVRSGLIEQLEVEFADVCDTDAMRKIIAGHDVDTLFHLAAQTIVGAANRNPGSTFEANIAGTWSVFEACRGNDHVRQIVFASSDKAYGEHEVLPYDEDSPLQGKYPYDVSKSCADLIAQTYAATYALPVAITRCGNLYGGGDLNWNRLVPGTVRSVLNGEQPVIRSDGQYVRDYLYVEDGAAAYMLLAERLAADRGLIGQAFNFSTESRISVLQLVERILGLMESQLRPVIRNEAVGEIRDQYLTARKAREVLQWQSEFSVEEGLRRTIAWYTDFLKGAA